MRHACCCARASEAEEVGLASMQQHTHLAAVDIKPLSFAVDQFFAVGTPCQTPACHCMLHYYTACISMHSECLAIWFGHASGLCTFLC